MDNTDLRGAVFVIRDDKDRVTGTVFSLDEAKKASRKKGWSFETVPDALTEEAIVLLESRT